MAKKSGITGVAKAIREIEKYEDTQIQDMGKVIKKYSGKVRKDGKALAPNDTGRLSKAINNKGYYKTNGVFLHKVVGVKGKSGAPHAAFFVNGTFVRKSRYNFGKKLLFEAKINLGKIEQNNYMQEARSKNSQQYQSEMKN